MGDDVFDDENSCIWMIFCQKILFDLGPTERYVYVARSVRKDRDRE